MKLDLGNREILPWKGVGLKMERVAKLSPKFRNRIQYCFTFICFWWSTGNLSFQASNPKWEMLMFGRKIKACLKRVVWAAKDPVAIWVVSAYHLSLWSSVDANAWGKLLLAPSLGKFQHTLSTMTNKVCYVHLRLSKYLNIFLIFWYGICWF